MPTRARALPPACRSRLAGADLIVHAGDFSDLPTLQMLRGLGAPLVAVRGNVEQREVRAALPDSAELDVGGLTLAVVHDAGPEAGRLERLRRRFPRAGLVIFGHSHIPLRATAEDGFTILNPGSPTDRRRAPRHSMAEVVLGDQGPPRIAFWAVDDPPGPLAPQLVREGHS